MMHMAFISIATFIASVGVHIFLHRLIRPTVAAISAYLGGLMFLFAMVGQTQYPLTATILYCLLVLGYLLYFFSFLNDAESPSARVLSIVRSRGPIRHKQILTYFTDDDLIGMRITRLLGSGWIAKRRGTLIATRRGRLIAELFARYRGLLGWGEGG